jgi:hypothetical protein
MNALLYLRLLVTLAPDTERRRRETAPMAPPQLHESLATGRLLRMSWNCILQACGASGNFECVGFARAKLVEIDRKITSIEDLLHG